MRCCRHDAVEFDVLTVNVLKYRVQLGRVSEQPATPPVTHSTQHAPSPSWLR